MPNIGLGCSLVQVCETYHARSVDRKLEDSCDMTRRAVSALPNEDNDRLVVRHSNSSLEFAPLANRPGVIQPHKLSSGMQSRTPGSLDVEVVKP